MNRCAIATLLVLASLAPAQVPPEQALATMTVTDPELELSLWASEPMFVNPTCIDIDHKGRVWVCESVNYRSKLRNQPLKRAEGDRILILEDSKNSGKADKVTVFYQAPEILAPLGIAIAKEPTGPGYKVYVCQSPDILLFEDKDGDGKADGPPKKLISGFRGIDHDHGVHGILIGPDGKLYFSVGDQGVSGLVDKNGKSWTSNNTDCRAGTIWRCDMDGKNLELIAHNFRNEYEPCVDSFGTIFVSDNDDDGNQQTRICYVMPGGNYGYHPRGPGQTHWHEEQPGVVPKVLRTYFGSPTGMCIYEGTLLPKKYWGQPLHTDAGPRHVRCYHMKENGAGYDVERNDIVTSTDNWFRPSDVCVAPDGSVFISDWYDPGVGGHGMGDITRGRIFRLAPKGNKPSVPRVVLDTNDGVLAALASPNLAVRHMAMAQLRNITPDAAATLLEKAIDQEADPFLRARALWQHAWALTIQFKGIASERDEREQRKKLDAALAGKFFLGTMVERDTRFKVVNCRIFQEYFGTTADKWLPYLLNMPTAVRREALLFSRHTDAARVKPVILDLAKQYAGIPTSIKNVRQLKFDDSKDRFYLAAIGIAVGTDPKRREILLAEFEKEFPELNDKVLDLVWELRPPQMLPQLEKRLADAKLSASQRARIVDILAAADDVGAGKALLKILSTDVPNDVRNQVVENLKLFLPGKWSGLRASRELSETIDGLLNKPETRSTALALIGAAEKVDAIKRVAELAGDSKESVVVRSSAIQTLGQLTPVEAVTVLDGLLKIEPPALRIEVVKALGQHTTPRKGRPDTPPALKSLQQVLGKGFDRDIQLAAVDALAASQTGTAWLLSANDRNELPADLLPDVGRAVRNTPFQALRNKALIAFPAPNRIDPKKIPAITVLMQRKGDATHGKQVMASNKDLRCLACHSIRGAGGNVGPDLSMIGKKASRDNLFESILYPNKAIADQFVNWIVELKNGQSLSGLIMEETPEHIILRDANAKDTKIAKKEIEMRSKNPNSIMPSDLLAFMTEDDLVDIVDYLFTLKTPTLALDRWSIVGPFDNGESDAGFNKPFAPEQSAEIDLNAKYPGKSGEVRWQTVKPDEKGYVDLQAFYKGQSDNIVSYLYGEIESSADQEALVLVGTDDAAKLWLNGKPVYENRVHRAATPEQESVKVSLKKGRNRLLLKINNGNGSHGFYLMVQAEQDLKRP